MTKGLILQFDNLKKRLTKELILKLKESHKGHSHIVREVVSREIDKFVMGE